MKRDSMPRSTREPATHRLGISRTDLGLLLMVVIWAVNFSVIKTALASIPPLAFNGLRFPLASLLVFGILRARGSVRLPQPSDRMRVLLLGLAGNVAYQLFFIYGVQRTRAGNASLLLAGSPIITALLSAAVGHERVGQRVWAGVVATFVGLALVVIGGGRAVHVGGETLVGDLIMLGASVTWAIYTVGSSPLIVRYGALPVTAWTLWSGTAGLFVIGVPEILRLDLTAVPASAWAGLIYAGLLGIGLAYVLWYGGVQNVGNTRTAAYSNLVPVLALLVAWAWLGEVPTAWQIGGTMVTILGVTIARTGRVRRHESVQTSAVREGPQS